MSRTVVEQRPIETLFWTIIWISRFKKAKKSKSLKDLNRKKFDQKPFWRALNSLHWLGRTRNFVCGFQEWWDDGSGLWRIRSDLWKNVITSPLGSDRTQALGHYISTSVVHLRFPRTPRGLGSPSSDPRLLPCDPKEVGTKIMTSFIIITSLPSDTDSLLWPHTHAEQQKRPLFNK